MPTDTNTIRRYLLGETSESESESLEKAYFAREEHLEEVLGVEEALIEDYLGGRLTEEQRRRVESHYLASPVRRHRVAVLRALRERARAARRRSWLAPALSLAAAIVVTIAGVLVWNRQTPAPERVASVTLPALALRDQGSAPVARIAADTQTLEIRLEDAGIAAAPPLQATLRTVEGQEIWRGEAMPAERGEAAAWIATVRVPARLLPAGDCIVTLFSRAGSEPVEIQRHYLRIARD